MEAQASQKIEKMSMADFLEAQREFPFELINGEKVRIMSNAIGSDAYIRYLFLLIFAYVDKVELGRISMKETFVLAYDKTFWVTGSREPDLLYYTRDRWLDYIEKYPDFEKRPVVMTPDMAVEVMSPNDRLQDAEDKVELYLADGVRLIWIIDPLRRVVYIYEQGRDIRKLRELDTLTGGDIIPGFTLNLQEYFAKAAKSL